MFLFIWFLMHCSGPKHIWPSHYTVRCAFICGIISHIFQFCFIIMKHISDTVFKNYSASGTWIVFSQVIARVIQRAEPTEAWDHNQQWFDLHHRSILSCCFSSLGAVQTERGIERRQGEGENPTKKPQPFLFPELTTTDYFHFLLKSRVTADKISKYSDALMRGSSSQKQ